MRHIKLKEMKRTTTYKHIIWPYAQPRPKGLGQKAKTGFFSESYAVYQIKGNDAYNTLQANILQGWDQNVKFPNLAKNLFFFQEVVMLHIKFKEMKHMTTCKQIFKSYAHPRPLGLGQKIKTVFFL